MSTKSNLTRSVVVLAVMLIYLTSLSGIFGSAVKLNEDAPPHIYYYKPYFGGANSLLIDNGELHTVYGKVRGYEDHIIYAKVDRTINEGTIVKSEIDNYYSLHGFTPYIWYFVEPLIEVTPRGSIALVYSKVGIFGEIVRKDLYSVLLDREGNIISQNSLFQNVFSKSYLITDDSKMNLLFKNGHPPTPVDFIEFHQFSESFMTLDDGPGNIRFIGGDVIHGRVHSNTDIYLLTNSWPIFHGLVTTMGTVRVYPGGGAHYPREQIFRGGLIEHHYSINLPAASRDVRREGNYPFGAEQRDDTIAYVTVDGSEYHSMIGQIVVEDVNNPDFEWIEDYNQFTVYDSYPPYGDVGNIISVNRIPRVDTIWTVGPQGVVDNQSVFVPMELWISGSFAGKQTWASSHNIYLKDNLTYTNTIPGQRPDGIDSEGNQTLPVNNSDYLGIISEKSIYVQYGHWSPVDSVRLKPNTQDIYLYGAYCALGKGERGWEDGVFTYQYQFPKGSTPDQNVNGEWIINSDLHRFRYPTTALHPWSPGLDYPWYNPLWPESGAIYGFTEFPTTPNPHNNPEIVKLRGDVHLYGSVIQRRVGYMRRSGNIDYDTGIWDIDNVIRPTTPPSYGAPNPAIGATGYNKRYYEDKRFSATNTPPHFITDADDGRDDVLSFHYWTSTDGIQYTPVLSRELEDFDQSLQMATFGRSVAIISGSTIFLFADNSPEYEEIDIDIPAEEKVKEMLFTDQGLILLTTAFLDEPELYLSKLYQYSFENNSLSVIDSKQLPYQMQTLHELDDHILWAAAEDDENIGIYQYSLNSDNKVAYRWEHGIIIDANPPTVPPFEYCDKKSTIALKSEGNALFIAVNYRRTIDNHYLHILGGDLYVSAGAFIFPNEGVAIQCENTSPAFNFTCRLRNIRPDADFIEPEDSPVEFIAPLYWAIDVNGVYELTSNTTFNLDGLVPGISNPETLHLLRRSNPESPWVDLGAAADINGLSLTWNDVLGFNEFTIGGYGDNNFMNPFPNVAANPLPQHQATGISVEPEQLRWNFIREPYHQKPAGFRVYFNDTGDFGEDDSYSWIVFIDDLENYSCEDILPDYYSYQTKYYWQVVPTTVEPERTGTRERRNSQLTTRNSQLITRGDAQDSPVWFFTTEAETSVDIDSPQLITELKENYPNPFNPETVINFSLKEKTNAKVAIYNLKGQLVKMVHSGLLNAGEHRIIWNGSDINDKPVGSGIYFYRLTTDHYDKANKMLLVK